MLELVKYVMLRDMAKSKPTPKASPRRPSDPLALAKVIGDIATGQTEPLSGSEPTPDEVRRVMSMLGKVGGKAGGKARAKALTKQQRIDIALKGSTARWGKKKV